MADDFDTDDDEMMVDKHFQQVNEEKIREDMGKDGYRAGISHGQEAALQGGFNMGFVNGAELTAEAGHMIGQLTAMIHCQIAEDNVAGKKKLQDFIDRLEHIISSVHHCTESCYGNPQLQDGSVTKMKIFFSTKDIEAIKKELAEISVNADSLAAGFQNLSL